jgi:hypothetical protein
MDNHFKIFSFCKPFVSKIWGKRAFEQYSLKDKVQNFGKDLEIQYAMNA